MVRRVLWLLLACCLAVGVCGQTAQDTLYQTSTLNALMQGLYDGKMTTSALLQHGNFGLGTFDQLDGEMVVLDGVCYQITSDGSVKPVAGTVTTPFAAVTSFHQTQAFSVTAPTSFAALEDRVTAVLPTKNNFYAVKVTGTFALVKARSVPKQQKPYPPLVEVVKHQPVFELKQVKGTLVGFYCPTFVAGLNVPGYHLHFLSDDRHAGGHVLDLQLVNGTVAIDRIASFMLALPDDPAFSKADLSTDKPADVQKVEK